VNRNRHSARKTEIVADKGASGSSRLQIIEARYLPNVRAVNYQLLVSHLACWQ
jgi:hypothetical protein